MLTNMWEVSERVLAIWGVISIAIIIIRFFYSLFQKSWISNVEITDHPGDYEVEDEIKDAIISPVWIYEPEDCEFSVTIVFKALDCIIPRLDIWKLDNEGYPAKRIVSYHDVTPDQAICFRLVRSECIPQFMIKWYSDYGEYGVHYFCENGRNGINNIEGTLYKKTFISIVRRILGLK